MQLCKYAASVVKNRTISITAQLAARVEQSRYKDRHATLLHEQLINKIYRKIPATAW